MKVWQFAAEISGLSSQCRRYMYAVDNLREAEKMDDGEERTTLIKVYRRQSYSAARKTLASAKYISDGLSGLSTRQFKELGEFLEEHGKRLAEDLEGAETGREAGV